MFTKENVKFKTENVFSSISQACLHSKEEIITAVCDYANKISKDLDVSLITTITIGDVVLNEQTLGLAKLKQQEIEISYRTAIGLLSQQNTSAYKLAFATLVHEFYHALDFKNILCGTCQNHLNNEAWESFVLWSEFFATYSTFYIIEKENLYQSFKSEFNRNGKRKAYYTARIMGYYLQENHSPTCDSIIREFLNKDSVDQLSKKYNILLQKYPNIQEKDIATLNVLVNNCIDNTLNLSKLEPISYKELLHTIRIKK